MNPDQAALFDPTPAGLARHRDPSTSVNAARKQRGGAEAKIMALFAALDLGGLTDDEICARIEGHPPTVKSARSRLTHPKSGPALLVDSGTRRASLTGTSMIVWRKAGR